MPQSFRQSEILEIARREGKVVVESLADHFQVTVQTIRRDLTDLASSGKLERVHGGAILPSGVTNIIYEERRQLNEGSKRLIAKACAKDIPNDASVFMDIGTSTEAVAREMLEHKSLLVVTNNTNIANILSANKDCEIIVTGGKLRRSDGGLIGNLTTNVVQHFKFDIAVLGCSALDEDGDLLDFDTEEVIVSQAALKRSRQTYVVADQSKFQRHAPIQICSLREVTTLYTDQAVSPELSKMCTDWNTGIVTSMP